VALANQSLARSNIEGQEFFDRIGEISDIKLKYLNNLGNLHPTSHQQKNTIP
jgi:hypothetical protein